MIKVEIKNKDGIVGWSARFSTQQEADSWINSCIENNCWGKPERWVREDQEDVSQALETREVQNIEGSYLEYKLAAEYSIEQLDITTQINQENLLQEGRQRQELGAEIIAKVYTINESKNISAEAFANLIADSNLERIERMLWTGSLKTAKLMIQALDNTYFTNEEKQSILDMLADY